MSSPDEERSAHSERLILWQRCVATPGGDGDAPAWADGIAMRMQVAGGELCPRVGASTACSFDPMELEDAVELALDILADTQKAQTGLEIACGIAIGEASDALDRAQLLANRANAGEAALDDAAHEHAEHLYLFARSLRAGGLRGEVLDSRFPHKRACRDALSLIQRPKLAPGLEPAFDALRTLLLAPGQARIALRRRHPHSALDWLDRLAAELQPPLVLRVGRRASGLQPLGGLSLAVSRAQRDYAPAPAPDARETVERLLRGAAIGRAEAARAVTGLLTAAAAGGARPWLVLDRLHEIDPPSLAAIADALKDPQLPCAVVMTLALDGSIPAALSGDGGCEEVTIEPLADADRHFVAREALSLAEGSQIARRVAVLGGDTALGILEAARTLVSAGDLVHADGSFRWRTVPRGGAVAVPTDALITERIAGIDSAAHRVLEAMCIAPTGAGRHFVELLAAHDGLDTATIAEGFAQLKLEGWLDGRDELGPTQYAVRSAVRNGMPPARAAELHRFTAEILGETIGEDCAFGRAQLAHHLAEGGLEADAARALLDAARAASDHGYERMAVRLAAFALKLDNGAETRQLARSIARSIDSRPRKVSASTPPPANDQTLQPPSPAREEQGERTIAASAIRSAIRAIVRGDSEAAENFIDTAVAAGWGRAGAQRLSAISLLARGDIPEAVRMLKRTHGHVHDTGARAREAIAAALILLESGEPIDAIRSALEALCSARGSDDKPGERASLHVLSACYRALGRETEASRLAAAGA